MMTSRVPAAVDALLAILQAAPALAEVAIVDGPVGVNLTQLQRIHVGWQPGADSAVTLEQSFNAAGARTRNEAFSISCYAEARAGDTDMQARRTEVFALVGSVETALRATNTAPTAPTLNGTVLWAHLTAGDLTQLQAGGQPRGARVHGDLPGPYLIHSSRGSYSHGACALHRAGAGDRARTRPRAGRPAGRGRRGARRAVRRLRMPAGQRGRPSRSRRNGDGEEDRGQGVAEGGLIHGDRIRARRPARHSAETTYGTFVAPAKFIEFTKESLVLKKTTAQSAGIAAGRLLPLSSRRVVTRKEVTGSFDMEIANKGMGLMLQALMGTTVTPVQQAATTAYLQTHTLASVAGKSLTIQKGVPLTSGHRHRQVVSGLQDHVR
jgi:hypothetical protein